MMDRYAGKPFLRLLECYILSVIGQLDERQREVLQRMEPKLGETYSTTGSWEKIVSEQMGFPDSLPAQVRSIWEQYQTQAKAQNAVVDPNIFAMDFVDQNFP